MCMHVCIVAIGRERTSASTCHSHSWLRLFLSHRFSIGEEVEATTYDACMQSVINGRLFYVLICFVFGLHSWCFNATVAASLSCIFFSYFMSLFFQFPRICLCLFRNSFFLLPFSSSQNVELIFFSLATQNFPLVFNNLLTFFPFSRYLIRLHTKC